jgi:hypothetical protein
MNIEIYFPTNIVTIEMNEIIIIFLVMKLNSGFTIYILSLNNAFVMLKFNINGRGCKCFARKFVF